MTIRKALLALVFLFGIPAAASAQGITFRVPYPQFAGTAVFGASSWETFAFTKRPVTQEELATAFEKNDRRLLNIDCIAVVAAVNQMFPLSEKGINTCEALAKYTRKLTLLPAPPLPDGQKDYGFARVVEKDGKKNDRFIQLFNFRRAPMPGERWLLDNDGGFWVFSLLCGNPPSDKDLRIDHAGVAAPDPLAGLKAGDLLKQAEERGRDQGRKEAEDLLKKQRLELKQESRARPSFWKSPKRPGPYLISAAIIGGVACAMRCGVEQNVKITIR